MALRETLKKVEGLTVELNKFRPISPEQEKRIMDKFRLDWNFNSNHLEGNQLSYGETKALLMYGITAQGKPLKDHIEIQGHDEALKYIEEVIKQHRPLTESFIRELHKMILKEPYEVDAITPDGQPTKRLIQIGQYKTAPNHVLTKTGEIFRFSTPEETPAKMHDLVSWLRSELEKEDISPVLTASEFHYRFIRIHPFDDGNGRLVRILMNFILMMKGYPPVIIKADKKDEYFSALQQADTGNLEAFFDYIGQQLVRSLEIMLRGAKGESIDEPGDVEKELMLLKEQLKTQTATAIDLNKRPETIINLYEITLKPLIGAIHEKLLQFDDLFISKSEVLGLNTTIGFQRNGLFDSIDSQISKIKEIITKSRTEDLTAHEKKLLNIRKIEYRYVWRDFKNRYLFSMSFHLIIQFEKEHYIISSRAGSGLKPIKKSYSEIIREEEATEFAKIIARYTLDSIKARIERAKQSE